MATLSQKLKNNIKQNIIKPRTMVSEDGNEFKVYFWILLKNGWEYYLDAPDSNGNAFGFVMGFENEWGSVNIDEMKPHIWSLAQGTDELPQPAVGYKWKEA